MVQISIKGPLVAAFALFFSNCVSAQTSCDRSTVTATHNVDIASMATGCVTDIDGLKTLTTQELRIELDKTIKTTWFNLTGIEGLRMQGAGVIALVVDTYTVPDDPQPRFVRSETLRKFSGRVDLIRKSGMSGFTNPVQLYFPLLDSGSEIAVQMEGAAGGELYASFGASRVMLEQGMTPLASVGSGARTTAFSLRDNNLKSAENGDKLNFASNGKGVASITIMNNTGLGLVLLPNLDAARGVVISSNADLESVELGIANTTNIDVQKNGPKLNLTLPELRSIGDERGFESQRFSIFGELSLLSLPRLEQTIGERSNLAFTRNAIRALQLPRLGLVNGSLTINDNPALFDIGMPRLQTVASDLIIHDNPRLLNFTANVLKTVSSISLSGSFTNVEFFSLERVSGNFEVIGDASMDCSWFNDHLRDKVVKGTYTCIGNHTYTPRRPSTSTELPAELPPDTPAAPGAPGTKTEDGRGLTTAAKGGIGAGAAVGALALIGLGVWAFLRWRRKKGGDARGILPWGRKKVDTSGPTDKPELDGAGKPLAEKDGEEVDNKDVAAGELPAGEGGGLPVGELPAGGRNEPRVARTVNSHGEVVELP